jgi:hypothetical protein
LRTGRLRLPIEWEAARWLRAVRRGEVPFTDWWERSLSLEALEGDVSLPEGPDRERVEAWLVTVHLGL